MEGGGKSPFLSVSIPSFVLNTDQLTYSLATNQPTPSLPPSLPPSWQQILTHQRVAPALPPSLTQLSTTPGTQSKRRWNKGIEGEKERRDKGCEKGINTNEYHIWRWWIDAEMIAIFFFLAHSQSVMLKAVTRTKVKDKIRIDIRYTAEWSVQNRRKSKKCYLKTTNKYQKEFISKFCVLSGYYWPFSRGILRSRVPQLLAARWASCFCRTCRREECRWGCLSSESAPCLVRLCASRCLVVMLVEGSRG